ncbi:NIMA-related kinase 5 [Cryptosporidium meleagridis]
MKLTIPFLPRNSSFDFLHKNYRIIEYVGKGQFGNTYKVENTIDHKIWLAKCIDLSQMDEDDKNRSLQEAEIMKSINHPYVIKCHESFIHDDVYLVIVMEYCEKGDIGAVIDTCISEGTYLPEEKILYWCAQLASGLYYLHNECRIIHRDIKPSNIFIRENGDLVIGDFGISRIMLSVTMPLTLTSIGTPQYMSPEMCENKPYTYKSDIWSFGCVLYELTCLKPPFSGDSLLSLAWKISFQEIKPLPSCYSSKLFKLIQSLLSRDPILRPDPLEILNNEFFQELNSLPEFLPNKIENDSKGGKFDKVEGTFHAFFQDNLNQDNKNQLEINSTNECDASQLNKRPISGFSVENNGSFSFSKESYFLYEGENKQNCGEINLISQNNIYNNLIDGYEGSKNSILPSTSVITVAKCSPNEKYISGKENIQEYCGILTKYEHQYFSVLVGRIQHHILRHTEKMSSLFCSEKDDILTMFRKCFKSCQSDLYSLNGYLTHEWFSKFVDELNVGLSENEASFFLSYIGYFIYSENKDPCSECKKNESKTNKSNYKIRHTKSSGSLLSLDVSQTMKSIDSKSKDVFLRAVELNEDVKHPIQKKENIKPKTPKIYEFIEKIYSWNKIKLNNKFQEQGILESYEATNLRLEKKPSLFPISPVINYNNCKQNIHSINPYFYLFITDWIQTILTPILVINNITFNSNQSVSRGNKITLRQGFHLFDQRIQGTLSRQHFRTVLYLILPKLTSVQLDWLYALAPKDLFGNVKYEQFLDFIDDIQNSGKSPTTDVSMNREHTLNGLGRREKSENLNKKFSSFENIGAQIDKEKNDENLENSRQENAYIKEKNTNNILNETQFQGEKSQTKSEANLTNKKRNYIDESKNERLQHFGETEIINNGYNNIPIMQQELYSFGIQDVVLLHYNSQACMRRPSPSPQLLARARNASFIRSSRRGCETEADGDNKENDSKLNLAANKIEVKQSLEKLQEHSSVSTDSAGEQHLKLSHIQNQEVNEKQDLNVINRISTYNLCLNISKSLIGSLSKELECLIQKLQVERIYTCWITAKASESPKELFGEVFEKLTNIRLDTSLALDILISNLDMIKNPNQFESIIKLDEILAILKEELPLQRDAIDCILRVIDHMELSSEQESKTIDESQLINSDASKVYKQIMKQAITNNIVLPISTKSKYKSSRSYEGELASTPVRSINSIKETDFCKSQLDSKSKVFDWTGKFLASFEFFGEATVNLIQCGINILESMRNFRQDFQLRETSLKDFSKLNLLIENYRQWSHLKEHVSRECAFVASIGANHDLKNDIETARIFLELLGARRFQVNVTWQQQSNIEKQLFRKLFLLEESLWNNQSYLSLRDDTLSSTKESDSELWLICGEQTCGALHSTCNKFITEIQSLL